MAVEGEAATDSQCRIERSSEAASSPSLAGAAHGRLVVVEEHLHDRGRRRGIRIGEAPVPGRRDRVRQACGTAAAHRDVDPRLQQRQGHAAAGSRGRGQSLDAL